MSQLYDKINPSLENDTCGVQTEDFHGKTVRFITFMAQRFVVRCLRRMSCATLGYLGAIGTTLRTILLLGTRTRDMEGHDPRQIITIN